MLCSKCVRILKGHFSVVGMFVNNVKSVRLTEDSLSIAKLLGSWGTALHPTRSFQYSANH